MVHGFTTYDFIFQYNFTDGTLLSIAKHLRQAFEEGLPVYEASPSQMPKLMIEAVSAPAEFAEKFTSLAEKAQYHGMRQGQHRAVQECFLKYDPMCVAVEFPVHDHEEKRAGLGDLLLYNSELGHVYILDFKPDAHSDPQAATQLYYYKKDFCKCTGIPPKKVRCFFFDDRNCYEVKC